MADKRASEVLTNKIHNEFSDVFSVIGCFEGTFTLQTKEGHQLYLPPKNGSICFVGIPKGRARGYRGSK